MAIDVLSFKRLFVRTPLEGFAKSVQRAMELPRRVWHPELAEIWAEPERIHLAMKQMLRADSNCVDIGCHIGSALSEILKLSPHGRHVAFEPVPRKAKWLRRTFPEVEIREAALSDVAEEAVFFEDTARPGFSGLRQAGGDHYKELRVRCARLDDELIHSAIDFLKVDVEGAEFKVFSGAVKILRTSHPKIIFESTPGGAERFGSTNAAVYDLLTSLGYAIYLPKNFNQRERPLGIDEFVASHRYPFQAFNYIAI